MNDQTVQTTFRTELYTSEEESNLYADLPVYKKNKEPGSGTFIQGQLTKCKQTMIMKSDSFKSSKKDHLTVDTKIYRTKPSFQNSRNRVHEDASPASKSQKSPALVSGNSGSNASPLTNERARGIVMSVSKLPLKELE